MLSVSRGGRGDEGKDLEREIDRGSARRTCFLSGAETSLRQVEMLYFHLTCAFFNSYALFSSVQNKNYKRISTLGWLAV